MLRSLAVCVLVLGVLAAPARGATVDDVALGETRAADIAVWGKTVAWRDGTSVLLQAGAYAPRRTFPWRGGSSGVTLGPDAAGRLVLVFPYCSSSASSTRCRFRRVDVRTGRASFVAGIGPGAVSEPVLRKGILVWIDGSTVRSRRLAGGRVRREHLGRESIALSGLDFDGRRFAITGDAPSDPDTETTYTDVRVGVLGKRQTRRVGGLGSSQEYQAVLEPMLNARSVDVLKDDLNTFSAAPAYQRLIRYPFGRGRRTHRSFGVPFVAMARGGGGTALVQAPGAEGCAVERPDDDAIEDETATTPAVCRVVLAGAAPFSTATRRALPELRITRSSTAVEGTLSRRLIDPRTGGTLRSEPVAGATVRVVPAGQTQLSSIGRNATTDAQGAFSVALTPWLAKAEMLGAVTTETPRAFAPTAQPAPGDG